MENQIELIYGSLEFINDNTIIVSKLTGFERAGIDRVNEIDGNLNVASESGSYDSYAYRSNCSPKTTLIFTSAKDYLTMYHQWPKHFKLELCTKRCRPTTAQEVKDKITALYAQYTEENEKEPRFAEVRIQYFNEDTCAAYVKMSSDYCEEDEEDDYIFHFCNSVKDLLSLCEVDSVEDFRVVDINCFFETL